MVDTNIAANEAIVNVTWAGNNGDLRDPVSFDATEADIRAWVTEAVRTGGVANIAADPNANFQDFIVDRYASTNETPYNRIFLRPKTPFGAAKKTVTKKATKKSTPKKASKKAAPKKAKATKPAKKTVKKKSNKTHLAHMAPEVAE